MRLPASMERVLEGFLRIPYREAVLLGYYRNGARLVKALLIG